MGFTSALSDDTLIIDATNFRDTLLLVPEGMSTGRKQRNYANCPVGSIPCAPQFNLPIIPQNEWDDRIAEMEANHDSLDDILDQAGWVCKNQNGTNYCFPAGTLIRMADGSSKPIEQIKVLDEVLSAEGRVRKVTQTMARHVNEPLLTPIIWGHYHLKATGGHPILTKRGYVRLDQLLPGDMVAFPKFKPESSKYLQTAEYLDRRVYARRDRRGGRVSTRQVPVRKAAVITRYHVPDMIELTEAFGRIVGLFLAEGHTSKWTTSWSFNRTEEDTLAAEVAKTLKELFGIDALVRHRGNSVCQVSVHGRDWAPLFEKLCGVHSNGKTLHPSLMCGPKEFLRGVLTGWMDGDRQVGCSAVTVSRRLAMNMFDIANSLDLMPVFSTHQKSKVGKDGILRQHAWCVGWADKGNTKHGTEQDGTHLWRRVYGMESEPFDGYVFNLEVEEDHSYVADGIGVHNCWINAVTGAVESTLIKTGQAYAPLSPASAGGPITGYSNEGGYGLQGIQYCADHGLVPVAQWPANAIDPSYATAANEALRAKFRVTNWFDLGTNFAAQMTALFHRLPVPVGLDWWGHEIMLTRPVKLSTTSDYIYRLHAAIMDEYKDVLPNHEVDYLLAAAASGYGCAGRNSWGVDWPKQGANGKFVLSQSYATGDAVCPMDVTAMAA